MYYNVYLVGKVNCKDKLVLDYSKFYKNNKVFETTFIVSSPSSCYSFSLDVPLMVPVIAKAALY